MKYQKCIELNGEDEVQKLQKELDSGWIVVFMVGQPVAAGSGGLIGRIIIILEKERQ